MSKIWKSLSLLVLALSATVAFAQDAVLKPFVLASKGAGDVAQKVEATKAAGGRVIAVGTTTLRALESAALYAPAGQLLQAGSRDTDIFITPGFQFKVVDLLVTNFHLPKSTLMMLVSALAGYEHIRGLYQHAIDQGYRFFSYGDAMLLERRAP